ncbi:MAG: exonuclease domain-containing protein, partial [Halomonas sp.]
MRQIILDTETTGIDPKEGHRLVEIGAVEMVNRRLTGNTYHQYINPERHIDAEVVAVHGIDDDKVANEPVFAGVPAGVSRTDVTDDKIRMEGRAVFKMAVNTLDQIVDDPILAITVVVEEPKRAIYGGVVAAPIFREIAGQSMRVLGYYPQPDKSDSILAKDQPLTPPTAAPPISGTVPLKASVLGLPNLQNLAAMPVPPPSGPLRVMPDLRGMTIRRAVKLLHSSGVRCHLQGSGLA